MDVDIVLTRFQFTHDQLYLITLLKLPKIILIKGNIQFSIFVQKNEINLINIVSFYFVQTYNIFLNYYGVIIEFEYMSYLTKHVINLFQKFIKKIIHKKRNAYEAIK